MNNETNDRLFEEQNKVRQVVSMPVSEYELNHMLNHPAFKKENFPEYLFEYHRNYPPFKGTSEKNGKIVYMIDQPNKAK